MPSTIKVEIKRQSNPDAPATTEKFEDAVMRDSLADHGRRTGTGLRCWKCGRVILGGIARRVNFVMGYTERAGMNVPKWRPEVPLLKFNDGGRARVRGREKAVGQ